MLDTTIGLNHGFLPTLGVELFGVVLDTAIGSDHLTKAKGFLTPSLREEDPCFPFLQLVLSSGTPSS